MGPVGYTPVSAAANLRRSIVISAAVAVAAIVATIALGHPLMGLFGTVGLALGALNNWLLQRSVLRYGMDESIGKRQFRNGVLRRLASVTLIAIGLAVLVRPDGIAVFVGLALFHAIMLIGAAAPVFASLRSAS